MYNFHTSETIKVRNVLLFFLLVIIISPQPAVAIILKIGTLAPINSPWTDALQHLSADWNRLSGGRVTVKVYAGGVVGEEEDIIRKMRLGQLQGAALTQLGLSSFVPDILAYSTPFMVKDKEELTYLLDHSQTIIEKLMVEKGVHLLTLLEAGWIYFFATKQLIYPEDLKRLKLGVPAGDDLFVAAWRKMGFNALSLPISDLLTGLQTGMIDAFYSPLLAAVSYRWFLTARHMTSLGVAPVLIGIVIKSSALEQIPADIRPVLMARLRVLAAQLQSRMDELENEALEIMKTNGLIVDEISAHAEQQWKRTADTGLTEVIGRAFSERIHALLQNYLDEYRNNRH